MQFPCRVSDCFCIFATLHTAVCRTHEYDVRRRLHHILKIMNNKDYAGDAVALLKQLIAVPSVSRSEDKAADVLERALREWNMPCRREGNNVWAVSPHYDT